MIDTARLLEELADYIAAHPAEVETARRIQERILRGDDPFTRAVAHHLTGSAIVARPDGSSFLLVYHRRLDRWLQPGGHVEAADDSVLAAALRETREETGVTDLDVPLGRRILDVDVHPIPASKGRPAHVHYDLRYLATTSAGTITIQPEEVRDARWFSLEEAFATDADESVSRALRKAAALLAAQEPP